MPKIVEVEKRDPDGRLVARVRLVDGVLDGRCVFYGPDGQTPVADLEVKAGVPVPPARPPRVLPPVGPDTPSAPAF